MESIVYPTSVRSKRVFTADNITLNFLHLLVTVLKFSSRLNSLLAHTFRTIFEYLSRICIAAQDHLLIGGNTLAELLENFKTVTRRCRKLNVIFSAVKTRLGLTEAPFFACFRQ